MQVRLSQPKTFSTRVGQTITVDTLTVRRIVDVPARKVERVFIRELPGPITLMQGDEYRDWTKSEIEALLKERL